MAQRRTICIKSESKRVFEMGMTWDYQVFCQNLIVEKITSLVGQGHWHEEHVRTRRDVPTIHCFAAKNLSENHDFFGFNL